MLLTTKLTMSLSSLNDERTSFTSSARALKSTQSVNREVLVSLCTSASSPGKNRGGFGVLLTTKLTMSLSSLNETPAALG